MVVIMARVSKRSTTTIMTKVATMPRITVPAHGEHNDDDDDETSEGDNNDDEP